MGTSVSQIIQVTTAAIGGTAPGPATGLVASAVTSSSLTLTWVAPTFGTTPFTYQPQIQSGAVFVNLGSPLSVTTMNVTSLSPATTYRFQIVTSNSSGTSTSSILTVLTPGVLPGSPTGLAVVGTPGLSDIAIQWVAPTVGTTPFTYTVSFRTPSGSGAFTAFSPTTSNTTQDVTGLASGSAYDFEVTAANSLGSGPASAILLNVSTVANPPPILPSAPTNLTPGTVTPTSIQVNWVAPSTGTLPFTYTLQYRQPATQAPPVQSWFVDSSLATGLNNGTSWANAWRSFSAIAWSSLGSGHFLYISGGTTSQTYNQALVLGANSATAGNPVTITKGVDAGHTGTVIIDGQSARIPVDTNLQTNFILQQLTVQNSNDTCVWVHGVTSGACVVQSLVIHQGPGTGGNARAFDIRNNSAGVTVQFCVADTPASTTSQSDNIFSFQNSGGNILIQNNTLTVNNTDTTGHSDNWQSLNDSTVTFRNNILYHPSGGVNNHGIWLTDTNAGGTLTVYNNTIYMPIGDEIAVAHWMQTGGFTGNALFYNNTIYGGWTSGAVYLNATSTSTQFKNNIIHPVGIAILQTAVTLPGANIDYNCIFGGGATIANSGGSNQTWAQWQALGYDSHGVNVDPLLTNVAAQDFTLQSGSPVKDIGLTIAVVSTDLNGTARPVGSGYSIGAYER